MTCQVLPTDQMIRILGRADMRDDAVAFDWTNSGVYFRFRGKQATISYDIPALGQQLYVQVKIDGRWFRACVRDGQTDVVIPALFDGEHTVSCVRINEVLDAVPLVMRRITFEGNDAALLEAPALPERRMIVIGDSITCGFGLLSREQGGGFTTIEEDGAHTYAALTAEHFEAQAHFICISGRGIVRNCDNAQMPLIPEFFELTTVSNPIPWNHAGYQPDIVVVNAGTNDTAGEEAPITPQALCEGAKAFISRLREVYPQAKILWVYGMMASEMHDALREAVASFNTDTIGYVPMRSVHEFEGEVGSCCHPTQRSHRRCAGVLIDAVADMMGWEA